MGLSTSTVLGQAYISSPPSGDKLRYVLHLHFPASNNTAEYEATLRGLCIAVELGIKRLQVYGDSTLMINQLNKDWNFTNEKDERLLCRDKKIRRQVLWQRIPPRGPGQ